MRITIHSQYHFTLVTLTEVKKDIVFVPGMLTEKLYSVLCLEKHTQYLWNNITPGSHVNENQLGEAVLEERSTRSE